MRPAFALCLLWQAFWPRPGHGEHPTADRAGCSASGACYSLHHATFKRQEAEEACNLRGGALSTVRGGAELRAVLALLRAGPRPEEGSKDLLFWVALERRRSHCTLENEPLRGFSWLSPDVGESESDTLQWVEEPQRSCTARSCAGLQATGGIEPAGWKEMRCQRRADGYLCKYQFEGLCPAPHPGAASNLSYRAPFQLYSAALDFSPPGTKGDVKSQKRLGKIPSLKNPEERRSDPFPALRKIHLKYGFSSQILSVSSSPAQTQKELANCTLKYSEVNLEACFTSLRFTTPAAEDVTQTRRMKNVLCQTQTYVTSFDHMSSVTQVIMNAK
ncbi:C-type lectin domain family 14 member A isoform X2 [Camelus bactrianus]|uniref:C-type lectin domain family 14 member A isoform X2 n=1 Tax=Camelus bactrianus TaxID=9837 RepID=A0AC58QHD9_CAMBA